MNLVKKIMVISLATLSISSYAGLIATTVHSRANCVNNESITWWLGHSFNWRVVSTHGSIYADYHVVDTKYALTWRQAAVHWGEGPIKEHRWIVSGYHYLSSYAKGEVPFDTTPAVRDCSIYNGWWDH